MRICPYCFAMIDDSELSMPHACSQSVAKEEKKNEEVNSLRDCSSMPFGQLTKLIHRYDPHRGFIINGVKDREIEQITLPEEVCEIGPEAFL